MNGNKQADQRQERLALINQDDSLVKLVQTALQYAVEADFVKFLGAREYERTEARSGYRNGSYERNLNTRVGTITLRICRDRAGEFKTEIFDRYQRSEKALVLSMAEMYFNGVSTRKVSNILEELCGMHISKSQVSALVKDLDVQLETWRERPLTIDYSYLIFDARYEKIRENGNVVSKAFIVAVGITSNGTREILGCWVVNSESFDAWETCIRSLKNRGLRGITYVVSDENQGLRKALQKHFQGVLLQRCQVHYMRNLLSKLTQSEQAEGIRLLQEVFASSTKTEALDRVKPAIDFLLKRRKNTVAAWLEETIEEALVVFELPFAHRKKMKSTNMLERFNQELKRRARVVRIFPNEASCLRLLGALCQETSEGWGDRRYLNMAE